MNSNMHGNRIAALRNAKRLSQDDLAALVGTSQKQISRYETDDNDPTGQVLAKLAEALETTADYLVGITDYPHKQLRASVDLNEDEIEMLKLYRQKDKADRQKFIEVLKLL